MWAEVSMDVAEFLVNLGRWEEVQKEYENIFKAMPDYFYAHFRYALLLEKQGRIDESLSHYLEVLKNENKVEEEVLDSAVRGIENLIHKYDLELDEKIEEFIKKYQEIY